MSDSLGEIKMDNNELAIQLVNLLKNNISNPQPDNLSLGIKLNSENYQLWPLSSRRPSEADAGAHT